jgi:tetratricopeptide (TPR) repeat protein
MNSPLSFDVFLSHSSKDKAVVRSLAERLRADGVRVWFDEWQICPGEAIPTRIEEGLQHSRVLVLCMSADAFGSDWTQLEAGTFRFRDPLNKERRFVPLRLDDAPIMGSLAQFRYLSWLPADRENAYPRLLGACRPQAETASGKVAPIDRPRSEGEHPASRVRGPFEDPLAVEEPQIVGRMPEQVKLFEKFGEYENDVNRRIQFVFITGEEGKGKTALAKRVIADLQNRAREFRLGTGRCATKWRRSEAYLPIVRFLRTQLKGEPAGMVSRLLQQPKSLWGQVLGLNKDTPHGLDRTVIGISDDLLKAEMYAILNDLGHDKPLLLFFDDLHWADGSTLQLLLYLVKTECPVFVIGTYRSSFLKTNGSLKRLRDEVEDRGIGFEFELLALKEGEVERYLFRGSPISKRLASLIYRKSDGTPLLITGRLNLLANKGILNLVNSEWDFTPPLKKFESDLPITIPQLVRKSLPLLDARDQQILRSCSMRGQHFEMTPVARVLAKPLGMSAAAVGDRLEALAREHSFVETDDVDEELPDGTRRRRYRFIHVTYQQSIYDSLPPRDRKRLSLEMAVALLEHYGQQNPVIISEVAQLFDSAQEWSRALDYCVLAAEREAWVSGQQEARNMAKCGLKCVKKLQRKPRTDDHSPDEVKLLNIFSRAIMQVDGYAGHVKLLRIFKRAIFLSKKLRDQPSLYDAKYNQWNCFIVSGMLSKAQNVCLELKQIAKHRRRPDYRKLAEYALGLTLLQLGSLSEAATHLAIADADSSTESPRANITYGFSDDRIATTVHLARVQWFLGDPQQAARTVERAVASAVKIGEPRGAVLAHFWAGDIYCLSGELDKAQTHLSRVSAISREFDFDQELTWARMWEAWIKGQKGDIGTAIKELEGGLKGCRKLGIKVGETKITALLAETMKNSKDVRVRKRALRYIKGGLRTAKRTKERYFLPELWRIGAELISKKRGKESEAEKWFIRARNIAISAKSKSLEQRVATSYARFLRESGRDSEGCKP